MNEQALISRSESRTLRPVNVLVLKYCPKQVKQTAYLSFVRSGIYWRHLGSASTEGQGQARESQLACSKIRGKRLRPTRIVTAILKNLDCMPSWEHRRKNQRLILIRTLCIKLFTNGNLIYISHPSRLMHQGKYKNISTSSSQHKNSFFFRTILHCNSLNKDIAESSSLDIFKNRLP